MKHGGTYLSRLPAFLLLMFPVVFQGCVRVQEFRGPNGRPAYSMSCGNRLDACYQKAGEVCPNGYDILDRASGTVAVPYGRAIIAAPQHNLAIECK